MSKKSILKSATKGSTYNMATTCTKYYYPNIYNAEVLKDATKAFVAHSLAQIDPQQKIIRQVQVIAMAHPFHLRNEQGDVACFTQFKQQSAHEWYTPEFAWDRTADFDIIGQIQKVNEDISNDLVVSWRRLMKRLYTNYKDKGPIAYVRAQITLKFYVLDKATEGQRSIQKFEQTSAIYDERMRAHTV